MYNQPVVFTNSSEGATNYLWEFGDYNISTEEHPEHTYMIAGQYDVKLIATNDNGCPELAQKSIHIIDTRPPLGIGDAETPEQQVELIGAGRDYVAVFALERSQTVRITVFDTQGRLVQQKETAGVKDQRVTLGVNQLAAGNVCSAHRNRGSQGLHPDDLAPLTFLRILVPHKEGVNWIC